MPLLDDNLVASRIVVSGKIEILYGNVCQLRYRLELTRFMNAN